MVKGKWPSPETVVCPICFKEYFPTCPLCDHQEGEDEQTSYLRRLEMADNEEMILEKINEILEMLEVNLGIQNNILNAIKTLAKPEGCEFSDEGEA